MEEEIQFFEHSEIVANAIAQSNKIKRQIQSIPVGKSASFSTVVCDAGILKKFCKSLSNENVTYGVISHKGMNISEVFAMEGSCLIDELIAMYERKHSDQDVNVSFRAAVNKLRQTLIRYKTRAYSEIEKSVGVTQDEKNMGLIDYAYLQRSCASVAAFRNMIGPSSSTEALKKTLKFLEEMGEIQQTKYTPAIYRILEVNESEAGI